MSEECLISNLVRFGNKLTTEAAEALRSQQKRIAELERHLTIAKANTQFALNEADKHIDRIVELEAQLAAAIQRSQEIIASIENINCDLEAQLATMTEGKNAAIGLWNSTGEQLQKADDCLRGLSSYLGQGFMADTENLDYDECFNRIKEGIDSHITVQLAAMKQQEPIAEIIKDDSIFVHGFIKLLKPMRSLELPVGTKLYTTPQAAPVMRELSDEEIVAVLPKDARGRIALILEIGSEEQLTHVGKMVARAIIAASRTAGEQEGVCEWALVGEFDEPYWESSCGQAWHFPEGGTPAEHSMLYCHHCGKQLIANSAAKEPQ